MKVRILVVDDELSMREFLSILLDREGYDVTVAGSADEALRLMETALFDLVLSDVNMPVSPALNCWPASRKKPPKQPC